ncbi:MAG: carboxypeptidase-like regulatory domain-containing protein [Saprospiraceae bacterium]
MNQQPFRQPLLICLLILGFALSSAIVFAQSTQTLKGVILDAQSEIPLIGATVRVLNLEDVNGTTTDLDGRFQLTLPVGIHTVQVSYIGYAPVTVPNVRLVAGKQAVLDLNLTEEINSLDEVVVLAKTSRAGEPANELAAVSARAIDVEQVNRFAGGRSDISRLASNFAGVATADDSRNDIVVRGNSPTGLLWQLEGIPIPNPNHFSTLGTTGGPVSALNPNLLATSDFLTSAFPAEYGNATSGVFDLKLRRGNRDRFEFMAQVGSFSGLEVMAEGPVGNNGGSFVVGFRNSFVQFAETVGIPIGTNATPDYRDLTLKIDLPTKKAGTFSIFGIGGTSSIDFIGSELDSTDLFADNDEDSYPRSRFGVLGLRHNLIVGKNAYVRTTLAGTHSGGEYTQFNYIEGFGRQKFVDIDDDTNVLSIKSYFNQKFNAKTTLRTGIQFDETSIKSSVTNREDNPDLDEDGLPDLRVNRDFDDSFVVSQVFGQVKHRFSESITGSVGIHFLHFGLNDAMSLEPRASFEYRPSKALTFSLGYGLHSQQAPLPILLVEETLPGQATIDNRELGLARSHQGVFGVEFVPAPRWRIKTEAYGQYLFDVPVDGFSSSFSTLNVGADFVFPTRVGLVNEGTGTNVGLELTVERQLSEGFYTLATGSVFQSRYKGSDDIERPTAFDNGWVTNLLVGKEWAFGKAADGESKRMSFTVDAKVTAAGGRPITPFDLVASRAAGTGIRDDTRAYSDNIDNYFRADLRFGVRMNGKKKKISQTWFIDLQNLTNKQNVFSQRYNTTTGNVGTVYQSGFFPDILYRIQF